MSTFVYFMYGSHWYTVIIVARFWSHFSLSQTGAKSPRRDIEASPCSVANGRWAAEAVARVDGIIAGDETHDHITLFDLDLLVDDKWARYEQDMTALM